MDDSIRGDKSAAGPRPETVDWCQDLKRSRKHGPFHDSTNHNSTPELGDSTTCVHIGSVDDISTGAVGTPIYQSSTFLLGEEQYKSIEDGYARDRFIYSRYGNPSQWAVQNKVAALESAESSVVFSSGMAAISTTVLSLMDKGGHLVTSRDLYGGTYNFFHQELPTLGMSASFVDPRNLKDIEAAITNETQILYFEILTNPLLKVLDVPAVVALAKKYDLRVVIDATFTTPLGCRPLEMGVDVVIHSASKYLNGHSDLIAGVASGPRKLLDGIWGHLLNYGGSLDPHACFLFERGLKTLAIRMKAHEEGALAVAKHLSTHNGIDSVCHPFLEAHPDYSVAKKVLKGAGGMVAFTVKGGDQAALKLADSLKLFKQATSLGGVESLISLPFNTSHAALTSHQRKEMGIEPGCVRLSVGIEDVKDLINDLNQALEKSQAL